MQWCHDSGAVDEPTLALCCVWDALTNKSASIVHYHAFIKLRTRGSTYSVNDWLHLQYVCIHYNNHSGKSFTFDEPHSTGNKCDTVMLSLSISLPTLCRFHSCESQKGQLFKVKSTKQTNAVSGTQLLSDHLASLAVHSFVGMLIDIQTYGCTGLNIYGMLHTIDEANPTLTPPSTFETWSRLSESVLQVQIRWHVVIAHCNYFTINLCQQ